MEAELLSTNLLNTYLKPRSRDVHKGSFGHVLIIGGASGFSGAVLLAALAAARTGAGLVSVATHPKHAALLNINQPELMIHGVDNETQLNLLLQRATVCILGCGLGQNAWSEMLYDTTLKANLPTILDADGLNLLAKKHSVLTNNMILTPHPGEAARLLNLTPQQVQSNRIDAIKQLQARYKNIIVLKGANTLIFDGTDLKQSPHGNPGMASGGMGDLLSGIIAGLVAQKIPLFAAAYIGVLLHGMAGDLATQKEGERGLLASDLLPFIRSLVNP